MSSERIEFPDGFLWGSAGAAHQVEGGNWRNDWWDWEHRPDQICQHPSGDACDHYHRYDEDFALLAAFGQRAHRFSIEWSRIEPEPGEFSNAELDHYVRVIDSLERHGLEPIPTLHHFTSPRWFAAEGGWPADTAPVRFRRFAERVAGRLGDRVRLVCSVNEPQIVAQHAYRTGLFPPGIRDPRLAAATTRNFIASHAAAVEAFGEHAPHAKVGIAMSVTDFQAVDDAAVPRRDKIHRFMVGVYLDALRTGEVTGIDADGSYPSIVSGSGFVGLNYYTRQRITPGTPASLAPDAGAETTQMGYEVYPEGFTRCLLEVASTGLPVYVTENGIGTDDDRQRIRFIARHVAAMRAAMDAGVDVRGYMYWSSMDNFEWIFGYTKTFGLIAVDRETFTRTPKPSASYFGEIARANALDPALTESYLA